MKLLVRKSKLKGVVNSIPTSKSHTIRAVVFASLASGTSRILNPLASEDTKAAINGCSEFGAKIDTSNPREWIITGFGGAPRKPAHALDALNSGTSTNLLLSIAALGNFKTVIDGDSSIRKRPIQPLLDALNKLGAKARSLNSNGCPPIEVEGRMNGGETEVECRSSQYVSSLLISCPLLERESVIRVKNICEIPYIEMTLRWLDEMGINYERKGAEYFRIPPNQSYRAFKKQIPADWSSAAFPLCAAAITNSDILFTGLDMNDTQGDKQIIDYLKKLGATIEISKEGIRVKGAKLKGCVLDLNNTPDALPAISAVACFAEGETTIKNVAHARIKETDRIKVMREELAKMGAQISELPDGLVIKKSSLHGAQVNGYSDHRVVMALSLAAMNAEGETEIDTAESVAVTFPNYVELMRAVGAKLELKK
ncbi:MAG: 3-phosphoshikimate 1-carboxyvinyltransferase [Candidatus Micrarchaeota archaeon]